MNIDELAIPCEQEIEKSIHGDLLISVRAFYLAKWYVLSICGSKLKKYVVLQCDRGGHYRDARSVRLDEREPK